MADTDPYDFPSGGINGHVSRYIRGLPDLAGKSVVDLPCGDGRASWEFHKKGATVRAYDLHPKFNRVKEVTTSFADLCETLPIESASADYVICQEGIEHLPNPLLALQEFNRILKKGGKLLLTTPNYSHLRIRVNHFLIESTNWDRMPCTELDAVWFSDHDAKKLYFGHLFLFNVQRLRTLAGIAGFRVSRRMKTNIGRMGMILGFFLYPVLALASVFAWRRYRRRIKHVPDEEKDRILKERVALNLSPTTLFSKHAFWELEKDLELDEVREKLRRLSTVPAE